MCCTEVARKALALPALVAIVLSAGCSSSRQAPQPPTASAPVPATPTKPAPANKAVPAAPAPVQTRAARNWDEYRMNAALRIVALSRSHSYDGPVPEPLLAIPVLEVELNSDGSILRINIQRTPTQATDTVQIALDAVRRAAPFGAVTHLPRPWKFSEVFLFNDDRRFKPRSLDL